MKDTAWCFRLFFGFILSAALLAPGVAFAGGLSYSYVEAGVDVMELDAPAGDGDGVRLAGSLASGDTLFLFGSFTDLSIDLDAGGKLDMERWSVGLGSHTGIADRLDVVAKVGYELEDVSGGGSSSGISAAFGVRAALLVELAGGLTYRYLDSDGSLATHVRAVIPLAPLFSFFVGAEASDDEAIYRGGLRLSF
ncbi:MAG: hypothetical protein ACE5FN_08350 [Leptospirillia bacterium]